jgi:hypothetical protein
MAWYLVKHRDNFTFYLYLTLKLSYKTSEFRTVAMLVFFGGDTVLHTCFVGTLLVYLCSSSTPPWRGAQSKHKDKFTFTQFHKAGFSVPFDTVIIL